MQRDRRGYDTPHLPSVFHQAARPGLKHDVSVGRTLRGAGQRVDIHDLCSRFLIERLAVHHLFEKAVGHSRCVRVTIGDGVAERLAVRAKACKVDAPRVDADALDGCPAADGFQCLDDLLVEREDIPVEMVLAFYERIDEARQLLGLYLAVRDGSENRAAAGGA